MFPVKVAIKDISLTDFYSRIIIDEKGETNLSKIFEQEPEKQKKTKASSDLAGTEKMAGKSLSDIRVDNITLQGGQIEFSDYLTQPNFSASMNALAGSVTGLSSNETSRAKLHLKGVHGQSAPLEITGDINPLAQSKFADISVLFKDIELIHFTPYAAKYLGYEIEKGKLILDLDYLIQGNMLKSENHVRFDNFALGSRVESKDATSLPVSLAISLLKNKQGQINLDLPVSGQLDDPEFSFAGIVFKMIGNLIVKVATSPFSIIGAMFGGGEELEYLDFDPGETRITDMHLEKINKLLDILVTKPDLKLEIQGMIDPESEAQILKSKGFEELIKAEKIKQLLAKGSDVKTLKEVSISKEEMPVYIYLAYTKATFPKPRNRDGSEKQVNVEEKKKLLMTHIPMRKEELRQLSMQRAENIKAAMLSTDKVNKERFYILEPVEIGEDQKGSRVKFSLK